MLSVLIFAAGLTLPSGAVGLSEPWMEWDPKTISGCTWWWDNYGEWTCEEVRDIEYLISPEDFHRWNPSITVDCSNWHQNQSYCVVVQSEKKPSTSTSSPTRTPPTSTPILVQRPIPTAWESLGCFIHDPENPVFNDSVLSGNPNLTIEKCESACWSASFNFAGLQGGLNCLCADSAGITTAKNKSDCNSPCPGNSAEACGGSTAVNAFMGHTREPWEVSTEISSATTASLLSAVTVTAVTNSQSTPVPTQADISGWRPMGCFADDGTLFLSKVDVPGGKLNFTRIACFDACSKGKYNYAGIENGYDCWCDNANPALGNSPVGGEECNRHCRGNATELCGGLVRMDVYVHNAQLHGHDGDEDGGSDEESERVSIGVKFTYTIGGLAAAFCVVPIIFM